MSPRRVALYFAWSRPAEIEGSPLGDLDNRYPTLFEFRRAIWPVFESLKDPKTFSQDVSGFLDHIILADFKSFERVIREETGLPVPVIQRVQPPAHGLDKDFLAGCDTLIVVSLDHFRTKQSASLAEIECVRDFLQRENTCLFVCPHHDIGAREFAEQVVEHTHHTDSTIPGQQRIGGFARSLLAGLNVPVLNRWGLNPAAEADGSPSALRVQRDADAAEILKGVSTFNLHPHLPHLSFDLADSSRIQVLAEQRINPGAKAHPFVDEGNRYFHALLQLRPPETAGKVYVGDATLWSSAFGGLPSLTALWKNVARMRL